MSVIILFLLVWLIFGSAAVLGAIIGLMLGGPVGAVILGFFGWVISGDTER